MYVTRVEVILYQSKKKLFFVIVCTAGYFFFSALSLPSLAMLLSALPEFMGKNQLCNFNRLRNFVDLVDYLLIYLIHIFHRGEWNIYSVLCQYTYKLFEH